MRHVAGCVWLGAKAGLAGSFRAEKVRHHDQLSEAQKLEFSFLGQLKLYILSP